jgi:hypothetical protein
MKNAENSLQADLENKSITYSAKACINIFIQFYNACKRRDIILIYD